MGSYSKFIEQDTIYLNPDISVREFKRLQDGDYLPIDISDGFNVDFERNWDDIKLYGYLNDKSELIPLLQIIARNIDWDGEHKCDDMRTVTWEYEEGFQFRIVFKRESREVYLQVEDPQPRKFHKEMEHLGGKSKYSQMEK